MKRRTALLGLISAVAVWVMPGYANSQTNTYPDRTVTIIVPYTPGGFNDTMARVFARELQKDWGKSVIVENKAGAGTVIGTALGARAAPDGYTLTVVGFPLVANQFLYKKLPYDAQKAFVPVILGAQTPDVLAVRANSPYKTVGDLVAAAKASPGKISFATSGTGTSTQLAVAYFESAAHIKVLQVPYKGSAPMMNAILAGQVDAVFNQPPNVLPLVKAGKLRALGVTSLKPSPFAADVPTIAAQGYPGFQVSVWFGLAAPAGTPKPILTKLNTALNKAIASKDVREIFAHQNVEPLGGSLADFETLFHSQSTLWGNVIRSNHIAVR